MSQESEILEAIKKQLEQMKKYEEIERNVQIMIYSGLYLSGIGKRIPENNEN